MFSPFAVIALLSFLLGWKTDGLGRLMKARALMFAGAALGIAVAIAIAHELGGVTTVAILRFLVSWLFCATGYYIGRSTRSIFGGFV